MIRRFFTGSILGIGILGLACSEDVNPNPGTGGTTGTGAAPGTGATVGTGATQGTGATGAGGAGVGGSGATPGVGGTAAGGTAAGGTGTGGAGVGGNPGTGGGTPIVKPSLVTSGEATGYWNVGEVTPGGTTATITVDTTQAFQTWHGWGGTFNEAGWDALMVLSEADRAAVMKLLFDDAEGIGFDWGRIPIGPSDYALARYTLSSGPGMFDISHDESTLIPYIKAAQALKGNVKFWASPWSPPPWAKTNPASCPGPGCLENEGYDKGIFNTASYQDYANYFVAWIQAYEAAGIPIDHVMPQNEPGWSQSYPTCSFGPGRDTVANADISPAPPVTLGTFVDGYLFPALDAASLPTEVWFGTLSNNDTYDNYYGDMKSKASWDRIVGVGLQWATEPRVGSIVSDGKLVMQSEHKCGNYPWGKGNEVPAYVTHKENQPAGDTAPNDYNYGHESWDLFKSWLERGVHIYSAWNMVLDTHGANLDDNRRWHQNALIVIDRGTNQFRATPYYYVFRHIGQYADIGATRVGVTGGNALAFKNPDGSVMTAVFNEGGSPAMTTLSVDGAMVTFEVPAGGWATVNM